MRTLTLARAGALITASALAFSLGAGPVSAADTTTESAQAAAAEAPAPLEASSVVSGIRFSSSTITSAIATPFVASAAVAGTDDTATASVKVNGRTKGNLRVYFSPDRTQVGLLIPRGWGAGKVRVNIGGNISNQFYARKQVTSTKKYPLKIHRVNSKITFKAAQIKRINPSNGKLVSAKKVKLQQRKNGKWKTLKTIKLNSKGNGSYTKKLSTKYRYRLYSSKTSTQEQFRTNETGKI